MLFILYHYSDLLTYLLTYLHLQPESTGECSWVVPGFVLGEHRSDWRWQRYAWGRRLSFPVTDLLLDLSLSLSLCVLYICVMCTSNESHIKWALMDSIWCQVRTDGFVLNIVSVTFLLWLCSCASDRVPGRLDDLDFFRDWDWWFPKIDLCLINKYKCRRFLIVPKYNRLCLGSVNSVLNSVYCTYK